MGKCKARWLQSHGFLPKISSMKCLLLGPDSLPRGNGMENQMSTGLAAPDLTAWSAERDVSPERVKGSGQGGVFFFFFFF